MIYVSAEDFFERTSHLHILNRQEEIECAKRMLAGDPSARSQIIESYLPMVAAHIKRMPAQMQCLGLVLYCVKATEKAVDSFNFLQSSETFTHRLSWYLRNATASYIVRNGG